MSRVTEQPALTIDHVANVLGAVSSAVTDRLSSQTRALPPPADHPSCLAALNVADWLPEITLPDLGAALDLSQSATQRVVDRLELAGLVRRRTVRGDRRIRLSVTAAGHDLAGAYRRNRQALLKKMLRQIPADGWRRLGAELEELAAVLAREPTDVVGVCRLCSARACGADEQCPVWMGAVHRTQGSSGSTPISPAARPGAAHR